MIDLKTLQKHGHLIPLEKAGKKPTIKEWQNPTKQTETEAQTRFMLGQGNIGLALDETTLVIDVDPRNGGSESYLRLITDYPGLEQPITVNTASGGYHSYCILPPGIKIRKSLKQYPGIDFLTKGSYVVAPPSNGLGQGWTLADTAQYPFPMIESDTLNRAFPPRNPFIKSDRGVEISAENLHDLLALIDIEKYHNNHDLWMTVMAACSYVCPAGARVFADWSSQDPTYAGDHDLTVYRYESFDHTGEDPITGKTLKWHLGKDCPKWFASQLSVADKVKFDPIKPEKELPTDRSYINDLYELNKYDSKGAEELWIEVATDPAVGQMELSMFRERMARKFHCSVKVLDSLLEAENEPGPTDLDSVQIPMQLAQRVIDSYGSGKVLSDSRQMYEYSKEQGHWVKFEKEDLYDIAYKIVFGSVGSLTAYGREINTTLVKNVWDMAASMIYHTDEGQFSTLDGKETKVVQINLTNGTLKLNRFNGWSLHPHNPDDYLRSVCPIEYNPEAPETPVWDKFIRETCAGKQAERLNRQIHCLIAEAASNSAANLRKSFFLHGDTATGKSVLTWLIGQILGNSNTASVPLSSFAAPFALEPFTKGLLANITSEMTAKGASEKVFKELSGGDPISVTRKYKKQIDFSNKATLIFAGNTLPRLYDTSNAVKDRICILPLVNTVPDKLRDRTLKFKLQQELEGILFKATQIFAEEYLKDTCTSIVDNEGLAAKLLDEWSRINDSTEAWLAERTRKAQRTTDRTTVAALYNDFKMWSQSAGMRFTVNRIEFESILKFKKYRGKTKNGIKTLSIELIK